jgi:hypothetical protein
MQQPAIWLSFRSPFALSLAASFRTSSWERGRPARIGPGMRARGCLGGGTTRALEDGRQFLSALIGMLGSARLADRILVLDGDRVVEEGRHAELMQRGGWYARMLGTQAPWYA